MRIPSRQLERHLSGEPASAYLVAGEEPLLVDEAIGRIRETARQHGFLDRELHVVERSFRWDALQGGADNLSLFASRKILELRLPSPRPGEAGARVMRSLLERPSPDRLLMVVVGGKLDASAARSVWVKAFDEHGVIVDAWPIERGELPRWITGRARRWEIRLTDAAAELLADRVEGNLLAADQEIRKLALTGVRGEVDEATVLDSVAESARYDVFALRDAVLAGDAERAVTVLRGLRAEGVQPVLVSWTLSRELAVLAKLKYAVAHGQSVDQALARQGVWRRHQPLVKQALKRFEWRQLTGLLALAAEVDNVIKGVVRAPPWDALTGLVVAAVRPARARA